ncbi:MAG: prenyltransferase/squalene oxidase repeat-containing protein [Planctomycetia bacterium]
MVMSRRIFAAAAAGLAGRLLQGVAAAAQPPGAKGGPAAERGDGADILTEVEVVQRVAAAVDRALEYLAKQQRPDGAWADNHAVNGLSLLAYMGRGHVPGRGPYRSNLERCKKFILAGAQPNGFLSFNQMYEHGLATLALAEMYGADPDPELEEKLRRAVELIVRAQSPSGGWRYAPNPGDQDLSVSVMQIVALRAANNAEIPVPAQTIAKAVEYVQKCSHGGGGFCYQEGGGPNPQMSAAGALSLQLLGKFGDERVPKAFTYLANVPAKWDASGDVRYFYYFHYYAIQAHYQMGGREWNTWHPKVRELLLSKQNADGSWEVPPGTAEVPGTVGPNKAYNTAMACLILEIYMHFLPAYQR